ncbi:MAG: hypothetical protein JWN46_958 [Acidimicrobiales bacterium]|nr:hypothetical protein [Acidimicrobiales bacterium]
MRRRLSALVATLIVTGPLIAMTAGPASAAPPPINLAGFQRTISGSTATTDVFLSVPAIGACPSLATFQATLSGAVIDAPTGRTAGGVVIICANGVATYLADTQVNGHSTLQAESISAGDLVRVQTRVAPTSSTVTVNDFSKGWSLSASGAGATPTAAGVGTISGNCVNGRCSAVPAFSGSVFGGSIDGRSLSGATRTNLMAANGTPEATASPAFFGFVFTVTYRSSCTPDITNRC